MGGKKPKTLSVVGVGAFGEFIIPHFLPLFDISVHEPFRDISQFCERHGVAAVSFEEVARADVIVLGPPVQEIEAVVLKLAPLVKPGTLVLDVCSVKVQPLAVLAELLPDTCDIVGTHPLFGPQSGRNGIAGLNISVCEVRGGRGPCVAEFLREELGLKVIETTPDEHDRQMAYVQGLTHLLSKIFVEMDVPDLVQTTRTYEYLHNMVETVRYDSDLLFRAIENRNPYVGEVREKFFDSAREIEARLHKKRESSD